MDLCLGQLPDAQEVPTQPHILNLHQFHGCSDDSNRLQGICIAYITVQLMPIDSNSYIALL